MKDTTTARNRPWERYEQFKEGEHRPTGIYNEVNDRGGAQPDTEMRSIFHKPPFNERK